MEDSDSVATLIDSTTSKIQQLQKAFAELESYRAVTLNLKWKELEEHFHGLEKSLKRRFDELEDQEKEFESKTGMLSARCGGGGSSHLRGASAHISIPTHSNSVASSTALRNSEGTQLIKKAYSLGTESGDRWAKDSGTNAWTHVSHGGVSLSSK